MVCASRDLGVGAVQRRGLVVLVTAPALDGTVAVQGTGMEFAGCDGEPVVGHGDPDRREIGGVVVGRSGLGCVVVGGVGAVVGVVPGVAAGSV